MNYYLDNVETMFMGTCYQVYSRLSKSIDASKTPFELSMHFSESMSDEKLPSRIHVIITSDANSHGIILNEWREGDELHFIFSRVISIFNIFSDNAKAICFLLGAMD